ncbi:MAG TPA: T9SS type A sorting domain-containing protein, partial [Chitinophagaceae bacterium]|nr:T9SS type A sorting domain-containing protein [Chitinophagaceae bacterium]
VMTITNLPGGIVEVCFPVTGFSSFYCHSCNPGNVPLPVSVTQFKGEKQGDVDQLSWTSANERNHNFYTIMHSHDGAKFNAIGQVNTKAVQGNSDVELNYTFSNTKPTQGHNYYALEMTDIEQHTARYSQVIDLFRSSNGTTVSLYPNPTATQFDLNVSVSKAQHHVITLRDISGRVVRQIQVQSQLGDNHFSIDVSDLAEGIYSVQLTGNSEILFTGKLRKVAQQQD